MSALKADNMSVDSRVETHGSASRWGVRDSTSAEAGETALFLQFTLSFTINKLLSHSSHGFIRNISSS